MVDRADLPQPAPRGGRLLVRLCLLAFCGGLLLLLSSRPAEAAERREPGLLGPAGTTLKATAREVDSLAGRAAGSGASPVTKAAAAASRVVAPPPRSAAGPARSATSTVKRGAPAVTSPVRRAAPPTARVAKAAAAPVARVAKTAAAPVARVARVAGGPVGRVAETAGPVLRPVGSALAPVGSALAPVGSALAPVVGPVAGLVPPVVPGGLLPLPRPAGSATGAAAGPSFASQTYPARPAADGASSPAARSIRSWPALTDAVSLPGVPTSAELPAGGPDPLSNPTGAGLGLAALAAALLLLGPGGRGRARPEGSGAISRSYLPLVSPA